MLKYIFTLLIVLSLFSCDKVNKAIDNAKEGIESFTTTDTTAVTLTVTEEDLTRILQEYHQDRDLHCQDSIIIEIVHTDDPDKRHAISPIILNCNKID